MPRIEQENEVAFNWTATVASMYCRTRNSLVRLNHLCAFFCGSNCAIACIASILAPRIVAYTHLLSHRMVDVIERERTRDTRHDQRSAISDHEQCSHCLWVTLTDNCIIVCMFCQQAEQMSITNGIIIIFMWWHPENNKIIIGIYEASSVAGIRHEEEDGMSNAIVCAATNNNQTIIKIPQNAIWLVLQSTHVLNVSGKKKEPIGRIYFLFCFE